MKKLTDVVLLDICQILEHNNELYQIAGRPAESVLKEYGIFYDHKEGNKYPFKRYYTFGFMNTIDPANVVDYFKTYIANNLYNIKGFDLDYSILLDDIEDSKLNAIVWDDPFNSRTIISFHMNKPVTSKINIKDLIYLYILSLYYRNLYLSTDISKEIVVTGYGIAGLFAQLFYIMNKPTINKYANRIFKCKTFNTPNIRPYIFSTSYFSDLTNYNYYAEYIKNYESISKDPNDMDYIMSLLGNGNEFNNAYDYIKDLYIKSKQIGILTMIKTVFTKAKTLDHDAVKQISNTSLDLLLLASLYKEILYNMDLVTAESDKNVVSINTYATEIQSASFFNNNIDISGITKDKSLCYDDNKYYKEFDVDNFFKYLNDDGFLYAGRLRFTVLTNILSRYIELNNINLDRENPKKCVDKIVKDLINDDLFWSKYFNTHEYLVYKKAFSRVDPYILSKQRKTDKIIIGIKLTTWINIHGRLGCRLAKTFIL